MFLQAAALIPTASKTVVPQVSFVQAGMEQYLQSHPFYRHPARVEPPESGLKISARIGRTLLVGFKPLDALRKLLKKKELSADETHQMILEASALLKYAKDHMRKDLRGLTLTRAVDAACFILIVVDSLYVAGHVIGPSSGYRTWLPELMQMIPPLNVKKPAFKALSKAHDNYSDIHEVFGALEYYKTCNRPPASVLVPLKLRLLCIYPSSRFRTTSWQPWRDDNEEWEEAY